MLRVSGHTKGMNSGGRNLLSSFVAQHALGHKIPRWHFTVWKITRKYNLDQAGSAWGLSTEPRMSVEERPFRREHVCASSHGATWGREGPPSPPGKPWSWQQPEISSEAAWPCRTCGSTSDGHQLSHPEQSGGSRSRLQDTRRMSTDVTEFLNISHPSFLSWIRTCVKWCQGKNLQCEESVTWANAAFLLIYSFLIPGRSRENFPQETLTFKHYFFYIKQISYLLMFLASLDAKLQPYSCAFIIQPYTSTHSQWGWVWALCCLLIGNHARMSYKKSIFLSGSAHYHGSTDLGLKKIRPDLKAMKSG